MKLLCLLLLPLLLITHLWAVEAKLNLDDPATLEKVLDGAKDDCELEWRGEAGEEIAYFPNSTTPYSGWLKRMHENGQVNALAQIENGLLTLETMWYENGQRASQEVYKNGLLISASAWQPDSTKCPFTNLENGNGIIVIRHQNGQKNYEINYKRGKMHGAYSTWHQNGQKKWQMNLFNEKQHGPMMSWHENGNKERKLNFKDGRKHGLETEWHENGKRKSEVNWQEDKTHGRQTWWDEDGKKIETLDYLDGKKHGRRTRWNENGKKFVEINYVDDMPCGSHINWNENGKKKSELIWKDGLLNSSKVWKPDGTLSPLAIKEGHGVLAEYHDNGQKRWERHYRDGKSHGPETRWDENGNVISQNR